MAKNSNTRKQHVSMRGKIVDMELLRKKNELTPAMGNSRVNARGDELGPGGKIIRKREDIVKEYYESNPNAVKSESVAQPVVDQEPVKETPKPTTRSRTNKKVNDPTVEELKQFEDVNEGWEEDTEGNFVKKGS
jgi:hypothetical protein